MSNGGMVTITVKIIPHILVGSRFSQIWHEVCIALLSESTCTPVQGSAFHKAVRACVKRFLDIVYQPLGLKCPHSPIVQSSLLPRAFMEAALSAQPD